MPLPIEPLLPELVQRLPAGGTLLLQAPPGAGKTTGVPLALLEALPPESGRVLMLEPRRLAAKAAAQRLASSLGEDVGQRIGYRVRLESRVSAVTRVEVLTDGLFLRQLQSDPSLEGVACVIFDEFHERRSEADLALALLREARAVIAPEVRLLVMSATLNLQPLREQLPEAALLTSEGRSFPVAVQHQPARERETLCAQVVRALESQWLDQRQDHETALVFLPGQRQIQQCQEAIARTSWSQDLEICPLHGNLPLGEQSRAIQASRSPAGKVVLATAIAESSLTIAWVALVIDSGLSRRSRFDPASGMESLVTLPASQASAEQRAGRAGRLGPGRAIRLWSPAEQQRRPAFDPPALLEADPAPLVLQLAQWGAGLGEELPWLEPPPRPHLLEGQELLQQLGALNDAGQLNSHGRQLSQLGVHPRLGQVLLQAQALGVPSLGCALAALLSERDHLRLDEAGCDLLRRLDWLRQDRRDHRRRSIQQLQAQLERQLQGIAGQQRRPQPKLNSGEEALLCAELIAQAYPERVSLQRPGAPGRYQLRSGRGAELHPGDPLWGSEALAIAHADGGGSDCRIQLALALPQSSVESLAQSQGERLQLVSWDPSQERVKAEESLQLGALTLERRPLRDPPAELLRAALLEGLADLGLEALPWGKGSRQLQQRLCLAHRELGATWLDRSDAVLEAEPLGWLGDQLEGLRSRQDLQQLNLCEALWSGLDWSLRQELEALLPTSLAIPSGRQASLDYSSGTPVLAVKLQELFGAATTPTVLGGRLPVTVQLLSPAGRPAAITQDLAGFWTGAYRDVRRDLRGRYPRHPWPEDPANATPTALTKKRLEQQQR